MPPHGPRTGSMAVPTGPNALNHGGSGRGGRGFGHSNTVWPPQGTGRNQPQNMALANRPPSQSQQQQQQQQQQTRMPTPEPAVHTIIDVDPFKGPVPGRNVAPTQYLLQQHIQKQAREAADAVHNEEALRIQGVQIIDKVRSALQLPVRTFDTAACYFHRSRLTAPEHNYYDAALAALFVACKVEDTMKKSREIACSAHNLKSPDHQLTPDDKSLERQSSSMISLERTILETIGFNFRVRHPQKHLAKVCRLFVPGDDGRCFFEIGYQMLMDLYKTTIPIKQTTYTMVLAIMELTSLVTGQHVESIKAINPAQYHVKRADVVETMLDILDLYTQHHKMTILGAQYSLEKFLAIKIQINDEVDAVASLDRYASRCTMCDEDISMTAPVTASSSSSGPRNTASKSSGDGTMRFLFSAERSKLEAARYDEYSRDEFEEYEEEVEEPIADFGPGPGPAGISGVNGGSGRRNRDRGRHSHGHGYGPPSGPAAHDGHWHPYQKERGRRARKMH